MAQQDASSVLIIIDPQKDFHEGGSLAVAGAKEDAKRIAGLITSKNWSNIVVTLDTHQLLDIGHPLYWVNDKGEHPKPISVISAEDVANGVWKASQPENQDWVVEYTTRLKKNGRYQATVWPPHCIIGSDGFSVEETINDALTEWASKNKKLVTYLFKGMNPHAEMYSCFKADVEVPQAPETKLNTAVLQEMNKFDRIFICGQASSHCVKFSTVDMVDYYSKNKVNLNKISLISDCMSPVTGFQKDSDEFLNDMKGKGLNIVKSDEVNL